MKSFLFKKSPSKLKELQTDRSVKKFNSLNKIQRSNSSHSIIDLHEKVMNHHQKYENVE